MRTFLFLITFHCHSHFVKFGSLSSFSFQSFTDLAKRWVSKRKTQLSHIITDINSNNHGREEEEGIRPVFLDQEPLETEEAYCV